MNLNQRIEQWLERSKSAKSCEDRPFISLCFAQSLDGSITINPGASLALSSGESTTLTHHLRAMHEGILVGVETVLADDPQLSVRECEGNSPQPIVIDSQLRIPPTARLCQLENGLCWIVSARQSDAKLAGKSIEVIQLEATADGRICLREAMKIVRDRGIKSVMVEGGAKMITGFLKAGLVDALVITVVPIIVGGYKAVGDLGYSETAQLPRVNPMFSEQLGPDLIMWGNVEFAEPSR
jgi:diaminohydroxyphosphoribosylaminopyrimidine deaminase/5-amino-6-(5-phosphoribosylamino)uracil reductase